MLFATMLLRKNGFLYLRRVVPLKLRPALGGRMETRISLKTRDPETAKQRWKLASLRVDAIFDAAQHGVAVSLPSSRSLIVGLDEAQREAVELHLLTKLEDDSLPAATRAKYRAHFNAHRAHSWRHTVATKLRQAGVREDVMDNYSAGLRRR
jgi:hypothetical protein